MGKAAKLSKLRRMEDTHATDGHCDHCGAAVPLVTLPREELARAAA